MHNMYITCCKIVGVEPGADEEAIKMAYRKAAKELHPDVNDSEKAHYYFTLLQNAYEYLLDNPYSRQEYDFKVSEQEYRARARARRYYRPANRTTLQETLKNSFTARLMYIFFHFFFIFVGLYLLLSSLLDIFFQPVHERSSGFSAYSTLIIGLVFGMLFTGIFSISAISYFRRR